MIAYYESDEDWEAMHLRHAKEAGLEDFYKGKEEPPKQEYPQWIGARSWVQE